MTTPNELNDLLAQHNLPLEAARFLPPGPDLAERAADLAKILRPKSHTTTTYGMN